MPQWDADIEVGEDLVRSLLAEQFADLDAASARLLGEGWDNSVWVVEERLAFRFPRRAIAVPLVERELAVLPELARVLPVPIPKPELVGQPSTDYPWPFFGTALLLGVELADATLDERERVALGDALGTFLRALHDVTVVPDLPHDPLGRADMAVRVPRARACLGEVQDAGIWRPGERVQRILDDALALPPSDASTLVHGDLHQRHVLVDGGRLSGVIDWGDVCRGDPSIDLQLVWSLLPPEGRAAFFGAYGPVGDERLLRARATALYFCAMLATYAHSVGSGHLLRECLAGLERTLVDTA